MAEPQPLSITNLLSYQEGAVVSREIIRQKGGTVTLFAFDRDQGLSEHTAPFDALIHALDGRARVTIASDTHILEAGHYLVLPANIPHSVTALTRFKMILTMIKT